MTKKIVYKRPKQYEKMLQKLQQGIENNFYMSEQILTNGLQQVKINCAESYAQMKNDMSNSFIESIKTMDWEMDFPKEEGKKYHMVIGATSSGKTSLINKAFNQHLPVGVGQITANWGVVVQSQDVQIFDAPGINQYFQFTDIQRLNLLKNMSEIFFCFSDSLKNSKQVLRVLNVLKPNNFCVIRTQVDKYNQGDCKSINQQLQTDRKYLKSIGISDNVPLYSISVRRENGYRDNQEVIARLKGKSLAQLFKLKD